MVVRCCLSMVLPYSVTKFLYVRTCTCNYSIGCDTKTAPSAVKKGFVNPMMGASLTVKSSSQVCFCICVCVCVCVCTCTLVHVCVCVCMYVYIYGFGFGGWVREGEREFVFWKNFVYTNDS